jgi:hypothetical protein
MAVSNVSTVDADNWQLITSVTPSGTSVTFNSFSGYKTLWLVGKQVTKSASEYPMVRVNNNTTGGNNAVADASGTRQGILINNLTASAQAFSFKIYDVDKAVPHKMEAEFDPSQGGDAYVDPVVVTSLVLTTAGGTATFTGGTVYLYGIAA